LNQKPIATFAAHFSELEDPRESNRRHVLIDIIVIAMCAAICGADNWVDVELFGRAKLTWLRQFLALPHGIPTHDTFRRVFARLDAEQFQACFAEWVQAVSQVLTGQVVAVDGKTLRRSHDRAIGRQALQLVSVWATENRLVLGQRQVDGKSNEITAVPLLLEALDVSGCVVTTDAMGCQTHIAQTVLAQGADYMLAVKKNQGRLYEVIAGLFDDAQELEQVADGYHKTVDKGHGRIDIRECWTTSDPDYLQYVNDPHRWAGLRSLVMVRRERHDGAEHTVEPRFYITSLECDAEAALEVVRRHWHIENRLHWTLDIAFREDDCRIRKGHGAQNFAVLRRMALNLLRQETAAQCGIAAKRKKAGWDHDYLLKVLAG
jgi:predicted transposase YbfD/YdcC